MQAGIPDAFLSTPLFGILLSLVAFQIGTLLYKKTRSSVFNPLLVSLVLVILFLLYFRIDFETYNVGGDYISFFLGPATVVLAVPLYKKIQLLKSDALPIITGISAGCIAGISSIVIFSSLLGFDKVITNSLVPKSVTTPIGIEISKQIGGLPAITVAAIIVTGIIGAVLGPLICRCFRINDRVAIGIAIGTASHALGTTRAIELGETEGAMSGLAIGIAGLITVFLAPVLLYVFGLLF
ncbi:MULTISPECIES: LrgB family protein [unclassified Methanosarcina]|uniref:LrgB family protein n=1 Tax=unclassified Methanosarcina TaxID=2644672 RepID=UPI00061586F1|nr:MULTISPECIES: LrgB family protein [unclassified Methanosarcina]AKB19890.1 LrgA-associated membrane protein LrgB [Methanosarcina sp. WWM596]AKB22340.1 LrgA-associated membrane protein LrgB [Methanosarcina sp. WH1]